MTGIYKITNKVSGLVYIGSSGNMKRRWGTHKSGLRNQTHRNKHLQNSWNKYGEEAFVFDVLEECKKEDKMAIEQEYLDAADFTKLYNISTSAYGPSQEYRFNPLFVLNIQGKILGKFKNGAEAAEFVGEENQINYAAINTQRVFKRKYRFVTPDFYESDLDTIKKWPYFLNYGAEKKRQAFWEKPIYKITKKGTTIYIGECLDECGKIMNITKERVRQLVTCSLGLCKSSNQVIKKYTLIEILDEPWFKLRTIYKKLNLDNLEKKMIISKYKREDWLNYFKKY